MSRGQNAGQAQDAGQAQVDALATRMLGGLLICGAAMLLVVLLLLMGLPRVEQAGHAVLVLPGTQGRHGISSAALPVLGVGILLLGLPGLLALARPGRSSGVVSVGRRVLMIRRPALVLLAGLAVLGAVLLRR